MRADGHTTFQVEWADVAAVYLRDDGDTLELVADRVAVRPLRPKPPVLTAVNHGSEHSILRLDLSDTDVTRDVLLAFLRGTHSIPFSATAPDDPRAASHTGEAESK
jgi:hypothetical protein